MVASAILFLDLKGKTILARDYRGDIPLEAAAEAFLPLLTDAEEQFAQGRPPILNTRLVRQEGWNDYRRVLCPEGSFKSGREEDPLEDVSYVHVRLNNVYMVAVTRRNANAMTLLVFLHKLAQVFTRYFGRSSSTTVAEGIIGEAPDESSGGIDEESLRDNFVIVYELLDEMMDFGIVQVTEAKVLQEYGRKSVCAVYVHYLIDLLPRPVPL